MYENLYSKITDALVDDGYIIIENALNLTFAHNLANLAKSITNYKKAGVSTKSEVDDTRRRDKISWIDEEDVSREYLSFTNGLREYLNRHLYLGLTYYEAHFARYDRDDFYEKHLDTFKDSKNRVVTTIYYLNEDWDEKDGGALVLYDAKEKPLQKVTPNINTLVIFMSEKFPHEVLKSNAVRYSIAGWYRIDKR
ncbi:2OG-Fe(II) oxygenase [Sulfurimonas sp.]